MGVATKGTVALPLEECALFSSVTALLGGAGHSGAIWGAWVVHHSPFGAYSTHLAQIWSLSCVIPAVLDA